MLNSEAVFQPSLGTRAADIAASGGACHVACPRPSKTRVSGGWRVADEMKVASDNNTEEDR